MTYTGKMNELERLIVHSDKASYCPHLFYAWDKIYLMRGWACRFSIVENGVKCILIVDGFATKEAAYEGAKAEWRAREFEAFVRPMRTVNGHKK